MFKPQEICCRVCGILSGLLLGLPNLFGELAPVQCFALLPVLICAAKWKLSRGVLMAAGMYMALAYTIPQIVVLLLPVPIVIILILDFVVVMMLLVLAANRLLSKPTVVGCFVFAALVVLLDWANFTLIPFWGTAQSIVRPWSSYRHLIAFTSITGMSGIIFLLALLQAAAASMINAGRIQKSLLKAVGITDSEMNIIRPSKIGHPFDPAGPVILIDIEA
jgi:apolipoprotein N-acyltransferase